MDELMKKLGAAGLIDGPFIILERYEKAVQMVEVEAFRELFKDAPAIYDELIEYDAWKRMGYARFFNAWKEAGIL